VRDDLVQQSRRATGMRASAIRHFRPMQRMMPVTIWAEQQRSTELAAATGLQLQPEGLQVLHIGRSGLGLG
jgi:hypothetical protein